MWDLMKVKEEIGVEFIETFVMFFSVSVFGLYFVGVCFEYFNVGKFMFD